MDDRVIVIVGPVRAIYDYTASCERPEHPYLPVRTAEKLRQIDPLTIVRIIVVGWEDLDETTRMEISDEIACLRALYPTIGVLEPEPLP